MNKAILMGRLARDPEVRQTQAGISVTRFTIAVNRRFSREGGQEADFIDCVAWREMGERIARFFKKGSMIAVVGSIQVSSWDAQDGKRYRTEVVVDEWDFTGSKAETGVGAGASYSQEPQFNAPAPKPQQASPAADPEPLEDFEAMGFSAMDGNMDDLPF